MIYKKSLVLCHIGGGGGQVSCASKLNRKVAKSASLMKSATGIAKEKDKVLGDHASDDVGGAGSASDVVEQRYLETEVITIDLCSDAGTEKSSTSANVELAIETAVSNVGQSKQRKRVAGQKGKKLSCTEVAEAAIEEKEEFGKDELFPQVGHSLPMEKTPPKAGQSKQRRGNHEQMAKKRNVASVAAESTNDVKEELIPEAIDPSALIDVQPKRMRGHDAVKEREKSVSIKKAKIVRDEIVEPTLDAEDSASANVKPVGKKCEPNSRKKSMKSVEGCKKSASDTAAETTKDVDDEQLPDAKDAVSADVKLDGKTSKVKTGVSLKASHTENLLSVQLQISVKEIEAKVKHLPFEEMVVVEEVEDSMKETTFGRNRSKKTSHPGAKMLQGIQEEVNHSDDKPLPSLKTSVRQARQPAKKAAKESADQVVNSSAHEAVNTSKKKAKTVERKRKNFEAESSDDEGKRSKKKVGESSGGGGGKSKELRIILSHVDKPVSSTSGKVASAPHKGATTMPCAVFVGAHTSISGTTLKFLG